MTMTSERILVAEDEAHLRDFICNNLRARGFTVFEAASGLEAMGLWESKRPDLLVLDLMMPHMDGLEVCRRIREQSTVPIIVLTALDAESDKVAALDLGADDYMTKPFSVEELLARVRASLRRTRWLHAEPPESTGVRRYGPLEIDLEGHIVRRDGDEVRLTPTEFALLAELIANAGKVVPHRLLLQRVWGHGYGEEADYLRVYLTRLRRKLEQNPAKPRFLVTVPGVGYRFVPTATSSQPD